MRRLSWNSKIIQYFLFSVFLYLIFLCSIYFFISIQPLGHFWQVPEPNQATGMALVRCILVKFLGVVGHYFPPRLDVPTFAARRLHARNDARDPSSERWNYGRERLSGNFAYMASLFTPSGIFYMPQIYDMGPTALLPLRRKAYWGFFSPLKIRRLRPGLNPRIWVLKASTLPLERIT